MILFYFLRYPVKKFEEISILIAVLDFHVKLYYQNYFLYYPEIFFSFIVNSKIFHRNSVSTFIGFIKSFIRAS